MYCNELKRNNSYHECIEDTSRLEYRIRLSQFYIIISITSRVKIPRDHANPSWRYSSHRVDYSIGISITRANSDLQCRWSGVHRIQLSREFRDFLPWNSSKLLISIDSMKNVVQCNFYLDGKKNKNTYDSRDDGKKTLTWVRFRAKVTRRLRNV